jgi:hypothetical protein
LKTFTFNKVHIWKYSNIKVFKLKNDYNLKMFRFRKDRKRKLKLKKWKSEKSGKIEHKPENRENKTGQNRKIRNTYWADLVWIAKEENGYAEAG